MQHIQFIHKYMNTQVHEYTSTHAHIQAHTFTQPSIHIPTQYWKLQNGETDN